MNFRDALYDMEGNLRNEMAVGKPDDGTPCFLNGSRVTLRTGQAEDTQIFGMGGYTDMPTDTVWVKREDWNAYQAETLGKNRVTVGAVTYRSVRLYDDPLSSEVGLSCVSVDT